ncbi:hypothetical protein ACYFX5_14765 [Bremerella sp. T1]|uniref:hypothetical protein n=1 Tax=Bremerella sp. TYQ1 TaxID=3119568 RepID=UPI001CCA4D87|nr:hypothetical protein [Bremerella volcania]UBM34318.1 hypothetical protein LA756_16715 [Bremerella volcania]
MTHILAAQPWGMGEFAAQTDHNGKLHPSLRSLPGKFLPQSGTSRRQLAKRYAGSNGISGPLGSVGN